MSRPRRLWSMSYAKDNKIVFEYFMDTDGYGQDDDAQELTRRARMLLEDGARFVKICREARDA